MVFRPTAVNLPQQPQQLPVQQQMAQMQAAGLHPVGMAKGGLASLPVYGYSGANGSHVSPDGPLPDNSAFLDRSGPTVDIPSGEPIEGSGYDAMGNYTGIPEYQTVTVPDISNARRRDKTTSLPSYSAPGTSRLDNPHVLSTREPPKEKPKDIEDEDTDKKHPTNLKEIKDNNFNLALIRAGLGMAAGKSSNALTNIAEGGIQGLEQYTTQAERDRARALEEQKIGLQEKHYNTLLKRSDIANTIAQNRLQAMQGHLHQNAILQASSEAEKKKAAGDFAPTPGSSDTYDKAAYDLFYRSKLREYLSGGNMSSEFGPTVQQAEPIDINGSMASLLQ
jgi:hypothetical protein